MSYDFLTIKKISSFLLKNFTAVAGSQRQRKMINEIKGIARGRPKQTPHRQVRTKWGKDYDNHYCFVIRMAGGRMVELREYLDTALVVKVFGSQGGE